ncbi:MAG: hypothetical protein MUE41_09455 [Gemmatimonadaceae bacterium]|nr:hypothetical protein [Gemmatimonadaceae bacterium]
MESIIRELGITFLVGACAFLGTEIILYQLFDIHISGFFRGTWGFDGPAGARTHGHFPRRGAHPLVGAFDSGGNIRAAVFAGLAFGLGVLVEDICHKFADAGVIPLVRDEKVASRTGVLVKITQIRVEPTSLARDLGRQNVFSRLALVDPAIAKAVDSAFAVREAWTLEEWKDQAGPIVESINRLYYLAKNTVYQTPNGYEELQRIQSRLDFSRSLLVLFAAFLLFTVLAILLRYLLSDWPHLEPTNRQRMRTRGHRAFMLLAAQLLIFALAKSAFERESSEFNKRAFGYFSSSLMRAYAGLAPTPPPSSNTALHSVNGVPSGPPPMHSPPAP